MSNDKFCEMFDQQLDFMNLLVKHRNFKNFPVDLSSKDGQMLIKQIMHECADELHEARQHLKNSKQHRAKDVPKIDRDMFVEELADALHYFIEILILSGISQEEIFESYIKKGEKNKKRILTGY